jgi:hypothetical protein
MTGQRQAALTELEIGIDVWKKGTEIKFALTENVSEESCKNLGKAAGNNSGYGR